MTALCSGKICTIFPEKGALNFWKACTIALEYSESAIEQAKQQIASIDAKLVAVTSGQAAYEVKATASVVLHLLGDYKSGMVVQQELVELLQYV